MFSLLRLSEIKNGRLAMLAITGFAVQEFFYGTVSSRHVTSIRRISFKLHFASLHFAVQSSSMA